MGPLLLTNKSAARVRPMRPSPAIYVGVVAFNQHAYDWNTSRVTSMGWIIIGTATFNQDDLGWLTSNVASMEAMLGGAAVFNRDVVGCETSELPYIACATRVRRHIVSHEYVRMESTNGRLEMVSLQSLNKQCIPKVYPYIVVLVCRHSVP